MHTTRRPLVERVTHAVVMTGWVVVLAGVSTFLYRHALGVVIARRLLPRWDLAAHLASGWTDYHYLRTLRIDLLLWDLWSQGYWPPLHSIFQTPFFAITGGDLSGGLASSVAAFLLTAATGAALLHAQLGRGALLPTSLFLMFLTTSPHYLAYATVAMSEVPGGLALAGVLYSALRFEQRRDARSARAFAICLTLLFFTKYNYFLLMAIPLIVHEYVGRARSLGAIEPVTSTWAWLRPALRSRFGIASLAYLAAVAAVLGAGGLSISLWDQRLDFQTIGYSLHPLIYAWIARVWFLGRQGAIDWPRVFSLDPRVRPLLVWFALPVTVWLAAPYPNHLKDAVYLVVNAPMGAASVALSASAYLHAIRTEYFAADWLFASALTAVAVAALRFTRQPAITRLLIAAVVLQLVMVVAHHTRFPRFLVNPMLLLWLTAAVELGGWIDRTSRAAATAAAVAVTAFAAIAASEVLTGERFERAAFENYIDSQDLNAALDGIREAVGPAGRIAVLGRTDQLSPGLMTLRFGPPSGAAHFPLEVLRNVDARRIGAATHALLISPGPGGTAPEDVTAAHAQDVERLRPWVDGGAFVLVRVLTVRQPDVALELFGRGPP